MIKIITFCIGVDVLGFPLFHEHRLKFKQPDKYIMAFDPYTKEGESNGSFTIGTINYENNRIVATYYGRKNLKK